MNIFKLRDQYITTISLTKDANRVRFCNYGGGFVVSLPKQVFDREAEPVDNLPNEIIQGFVNIDDMMPAKAYYNPHARWNGWATPVFEPKELLNLLKEMIGDNDEYIKFTATDSSIIFHHIEDDEVEVAEFFDIEYAGKTIQVVEPISGWCWDILIPEQACKYFVENLKHTLGLKRAINKALTMTFGKYDETCTEIKALKKALIENTHPD